MIKAIIFDMDGVLIDSEPLWRKALALVFQSMGIPFEEKWGLETMATRIDEAVLYWHNRFKWENPSLKKVETMVMNQVEELMIKNGKPKEGVIYALKFFHSKRLKVAIASSAHLRVIKIVVNTLKISHYFDLLHSAEFEKHGKPEPDVYLTTARLLGVNPDECVVFEDSPLGAEAAKRAGMFTIAIPPKERLDDPLIPLANMQIASLEEINEEFWNKIQKE